MTIAPKKYEYKVEIRRVVDGDTVDLFIDTGLHVNVPGQESLIDLGFDVIVKDGRLMLKERVRMAGIDTPESRTRDLREKKFGKLATARVEELLPVGHEFLAVSKTYDATGKYGRAMLDFDLPGHSETLCDLLVTEHLAVRYHGQNKAEIRPEHEANWDWLDSQVEPGVPE